MSTATRSLLISVLALGLCEWPSPVVASVDFDDVRNLLGEAMKRCIAPAEGGAQAEAAAGQCIKTLFGGSGTPVPCDVADEPGDGLVCQVIPQISVANQRAVLNETTDITATFGKELIKLLDLSSKYEWKFAALNEQRAIPIHAHSGFGGPGVDADQYIKRRDAIHIVFAAWQEGKVDIGLPAGIGGVAQYITDVEAAWSKSETVDLGVKYWCRSVDHPDPKACVLAAGGCLNGVKDGAEECDPTEAGPGAVCPDDNGQPQICSHQCVCIPKYKLGNGVPMLSVGPLLATLVLMLGVGAVALRSLGERQEA